MAAVSALAELVRKSELLLDILYPPTCVACGSDTAWLCDACQQRVRLFLHGLCPRCGHKDNEHVCESSWPFASVTVCGSYADPVLRRAITTFKYRSARCLEPDWKRFFKHYRDAFVDPWPWAGLSELVVTSIPGDPKRLRQRGTDHASILADVVRSTLVPWAERDHLLERTGHRSANANLPTNALRRANVHDVFRASRHVEKPVLLVDDVLTTGATALEAARILKENGATEIHLLTVAKG